jgi:hypothetical protein
MNFGQHIERAFTNFGLSLENMQQRHHDWNEESKALGLISDEDKLKLLKAQLYRAATGKTYDITEIQRLTDAIEILEDIKQAEFDRKLETQRLNLTLPAQLNQSLNAFLVFGLLAVIGSYAIAPICGNSRSQFCINARVIPIQIEQFFKN